MLSDDGAEDGQEVWVLGKAGGDGGKGGGGADCESGGWRVGGEES